MCLAGLPHAQWLSVVCCFTETESGPATLQKCLHLFTEPETLSSDEAW